ncbi:MAG: lipolytic enzyme family [Micrococcaceae bacterium]|nr:lipolytic enzyme family [Micrococcaceae bacterium]
MRARGPVVTGSRVLVGGIPGPEQYYDDRRQSWSRYVALGDSFTEGVGDPEPGSVGGLRGWADRVAEELATGRDDFAYANLAVRGLLLEQILNRQIGQALALKPDLVTLSAGGNDMVFHNSDPDKLADRLEAGVSVLAETGATIVLFTGPDWGSTPVLGRNRGRVAIFNENLRAIAARHDALVADLWALRQFRDPWMWDPDRLHLSPLGHHTVAMAVLDTLGVRHTLVPLEPKDLPDGSWREARAGDLVWAKTYLLPWALRQLRHRGAVEERRAKRPYAAPVFEDENPAGPPPALVKG